VAHLTMMYDLRTMSVGDIARDIYEDAYNGSIPNDILELSAAGAIGQCSAADRDFFVTPNPIMDYDEEQLSILPYLCLSTRQPEFGPSTTQTPWSVPEVCRRLPGSLGVASAAFSKLYTTLALYQDDVPGLCKWFGASWGLGPADIEALSSLMAIPRSQGATFWAGMGANLTPSVHTSGALSASVRVTPCGTNRQKYVSAGCPEPLIDWARVREIVRGIGVGMVAMDMLPKGYRLGFAIAQGCVPTAPIHAGMIKVWNVGLAEIVPLRNDSAGLILRASERLQAEKAPNESELLTNTVLFEGKLQVPTEFLVGSMGTPAAVPANWALSRNDDNADLLVAPRQPVVKDRKPMSFAEAGSRLICTLGTPGNVGTLRSWELEKLLQIQATSENAKSEVALRRLRAHVKACVPAEFLYALDRIGNIIKPGMGEYWVKRIVTSAKITGKIRQIQSFSNLHSACLTRDSYVVYVAALSKACCNAFDSYSAPTPNEDLVRRLVRGSSPQQAIDSVFTGVRNYWVSRYRSNATTRSTVEERVTYQILASCFQILSFTVQASGEVVPNYGALANRFWASGKSWVDARRKYKDERTRTLEQHTNFEDVTRGAVDQWVQRMYGEAPDTSWSSIARRVKQEVEKMTEDIRSYIGELYAGEGVSRLEMPEPLDVGLDVSVRDLPFPDVVHEASLLSDLEEGYEEEKLVARKDLSVKKVKVNKADKLGSAPRSVYDPSGSLGKLEKDTTYAEEAKAPPPEMDLFGGIGEPVGQEFFADPCIDLAEVLLETWPGLPDSVLKRVLQAHPARIEFVHMDRWVTENRDWVEGMYHDVKSAGVGSIIYGEAQDPATFRGDMDL